MYSGDMKSVFDLSVGSVGLWAVDANVAQELKYPGENRRLRASAKELILSGPSRPSNHRGFSIAAFETSQLFTPLFHTDSG